MSGATELKNNNDLDLATEEQKDEKKDAANLNSDGQSNLDVDDQGANNGQEVATVTQQMIKIKVDNFEA